MVVTESVMEFVVGGRWCLSVGILRVEGRVKGSWGWLQWWIIECRWVEKGEPMPIA